MRAPVHSKATTPVSRRVPWPEDRAKRLFLAIAGFSLSTERAAIVSESSSAVLNDAAAAVQPTTCPPRRPFAQASAGGFWRRKAWELKSWRPTPFGRIVRGIVFHMWWRAQALLLLVVGLGCNGSASRGSRPAPSPVAS